MHNTPLSERSFNPRHRSPEAGRTSGTREIGLDQYHQTLPAISHAGPPRLIAFSTNIAYRYASGK